MSRVNDKGSRRRQDLLQAAKRLIDRQGVKKTTMKQVVAEADTSIGNCYFYFPNKEALLHALVQEIILDINRASEERSLSFSKSHEKLACLIFFLMDGLLRHKKIAELVLLGLPTQTVRASTSAYYLDNLVRFFRHHPELNPWADPQLAAISWQGSLVLLFQKLLHGELPLDRSRLCRFSMRWNLQALGVAEVVIAEAEEVIAALAEEVETKPQ